MSGACGEVSAAIHLTPEAAAGGPIGKLRDGDVVTVDSVRGGVHVELAADLLAACSVTGAAANRVDSLGVLSATLTSDWRHTYAVTPGARSRSSATPLHLSRQARWR